MTIDNEGNKSATDQQIDSFMRLVRSLTNITPTPRQVDTIEALRESAKALGRRLTLDVPPSRETSLAITKLEECVMWGVKAILLEPQQVAEIKPDNGVIGTTST